MKTTRIKWDESMEKRCLQKCPDYYVINVKSEAAGTSEDTGETAPETGASGQAAENPEGTAEDIQWEDFPAVLDHALLSNNETAAPEPEV